MEPLLIISYHTLSETNSALAADHLLNDRLYPLATVDDYLMTT